MVDDCLRRGGGEGDEREAETRRNQYHSWSDSYLDVKAGMYITLHLHTENLHDIFGRAKGYPIIFYEQKRDF